ncbi:AMP-binding protein [Pseudonocardia halophobica]|uniref:AMP-dependent synthetase n=1 Tax=Pseudonocardia halophobica TaxID=29401 RepID=A0A9W6NY24_9PSEU|nr:AMP-binding protein [Pseudonocardia halophobica]GLL14035.1 AMP-dependent synthetase [Pseudonocardia halophobica]
MNVGAIEFHSTHPRDAHDVLRRARDLLLDSPGRRDEIADGFAWPDLGASFNWAVDWFDRIARANDAPALRIVEEGGADSTYSFEELRHRSDQVARRLEQLGVGRGDPVILMLGNQVELWESMLAVMKIGAVLVPTTTALGPSDLADRVRRSGARAVVANAADTPKFDGIGGDHLRLVVGQASGWTEYQTCRAIESPAPFASTTVPEDRMLMYFTSGTTSKPKLVEHTQASYGLGHLTTMYFLGLRPGDVHLNISSPGWAKHSWSCFFAPWLAEATVFVYNYSRFDAAALLAEIRRCGVTSLCAPPTVWRMLIQADISGGSGQLRELLSAGEPLNAEVIAHIRMHWGLTIRDGFGQTETTALVGNPPGAPLKVGSMGKPLPGVPVTVVDPVTGSPVDEGEICLDLTQRPVNLMVGYVDDPENTAEVMAAGLYHTGDVASRDADGYLTYIGRTDDVFKASDYKVSPFELESVLLEHPAIAEAAVVPAPDPTRLAVPKAYVTLAAGWSPDDDTAFEILRFARQRLAPYQRVRRIEFAALPKTISGKIRRAELRERESSGKRPQREWRDDQFPALKGPAGDRGR